MDEYTGKRAAGGLSVARRGPALSFRDSNHEDRTVQYCNRIGCSTRLNSMKGAQVGNPERTRYSRHSFRSSCSKANIGSSSKPFAGVSGDLRKPHQEQQNATAKETVLAESSSRDSEAEDSESIPLPAATGIQTGQPEPEDAKDAVPHGISVNTAEEVGLYTVSSSNTRPRRQVYQRSGSGTQDIPLGLSVRRSFSSRHTIQAAKSTLESQGADVNRYGLRNLGCASISDVLPSGCSSDSGRGRRADATKKRCPPDGESSSARGKSMSGPTAGGSSSSQRSGLTSSNISFIDRSVSQPASRRARNWSPGSSSVASVRTHRTISGDTRSRLSEAVIANGLPIPEPIVIPQLLPQTEFSNSESAPGSSSRSIPTEPPSICEISYGQPSSSSGTLRVRPIIRSEDSNTRPFHSLSVDRDGFRRFHMEGIAEVLLALERIEQDEELTYEQLMVLESNLFLGGLSFHDQHRDMRLDIDHMSYEELLALEEKMGTVSTALTEEALSSCLKRSCYVPPAPTLSGIVGHGNDDIKCSICQEEYVAEDEVGKLGCEHGYHMVCIHQWLRQKNWCPICKAPASPPS
ncbi:uncharacterized protein LOC131217207 [Magnolia sinica]|uniref:uncharacterized protein LOC131217207 n=1 Tax=Magnolia sinica TaxID=86752 RepID=UPI00265AEAA3|nr:uncharacterized protein LOC131217207 [Magnolia sinica]XP_058068035.1 uncharacterized protein LOC131217207 [Magnolia sinica]